MHRNSHIAVLLAVTMLICFGACSARKDVSDIAARAAKQYYDYLLEGKYESFVDGIHQPDSIPESYREQLVRNARMFVSQQDLEHRGLKEIRIVDVAADMEQHTANVFLVFCYGDSTSEEICVPMVENKGIWFLR